MLELLKQRYEARLQRDFATSDRVRDLLAAIGVTTDDRAKVPPPPPPQKKSVAAPWQTGEGGRDGGEGSLIGVGSWCGLLRQPDAMWRGWQQREMRLP